MDPQRWRQVRTLFDELVELRPGERRSRLERLGATDPALRDAVEFLLAGDAEASARLEPLESPFLGPADPFGLSGRTFSHFRVLEPLGAGGMGIVYRAEDTRLGRPVALKFLLPQYTLDPSAKERFLQEARSAGALDHPNLCTIYDVGESGDGRLFLAMPVYGGETLKARLEREGALPVEDALEIARQMAAGLACAHEAGIIHRDLKPGNVMLLPNGGVKILDFGLAKARDQSLTATGATLGTVAYMAPEQIDGLPVDARADLWSLGVVLYEMLTGARPFGGDEAISTARAIARGGARPPSGLRPGIPAALDDVVLSLLRKDPAERRASAAELARELRAARPEGSPPAAGAGAGRPDRRNRVVFAAALAVAALLVFGALGAWQWRNGAEDSTATPSIAVLPFDSPEGAPEDGYFASGMSEEILATLREMGGLRVISPLSVVHYRDTSKPTRQIAAELGVSHLLRGSVERAGDSVRIAVTLIDAVREAPILRRSYSRSAANVLAAQTEIAEDVARLLEPKISPGARAPLARRTTTDFTAQDLFFRGREHYNRLTAQDAEVAIGFFRGALARDSTYLDAVISLADAYRIKGQLGGGQAWKDSAEATARRAVAMDSTSGRAYEALGWALNWQDKDDAAREAYSRAMHLDAAATGGLADLYLHGYGRVDDALRLFKNALTENPTDPLLNDLTGWTYMTLGMYGEAREYFYAAILIQPVYLHPYPRRALLSLLMENHDAEEHIKRIVDMFGDTPAGLERAAQVAFRAGDLATARTYYERRLVSHGGDLSVTHGLNLAWIYQRHGETERARDLVRRLGSHPGWTARYRNGDSYASQAALNVLLDNRSEAIRLFEIAVNKHWVDYYLLPADPILGSLRGDPTFEALLARVKAKVDAQRARVKRYGW